MPGFLSRLSNWLRLWRDYYRKTRPAIPGPPPDFRNVAYGTHRRQKLDIWLAGSDRPAPVLVFFHGGGLVRGRKFYSRLMRELHPNGVTVVAANYRLAWPHGRSIADCMEDAASAVRFLRENADRWNLDRERFAVTGNSGGGCLALWLALNPKAAGPMRCAVTWDAPAVIDPKIFRSVLGNYDLNDFLPVWSAVFDVRRRSNLDSGGVRSIIDSYSPLNFASADSPPVFLRYSKGPDHTPRHPMDILHSARTGQILMDALQKEGTTCFLTWPGKEAPMMPDEFLRQKLEVRG